MFNKLQRAKQILLSSIAAYTLFVGSAAADIYQWEYVDPADPSQGRQQSAVLCVNGAGKVAQPEAGLEYLDLTAAYLVGADLREAYFDRSYLNDADFGQANLADVSFDRTRLANANFQARTCGERTSVTARITVSLPRSSIRRLATRPTTWPAPISKRKISPTGASRGKT